MISAGKLGMLAGASGALEGGPYLFFPGGGGYGLVDVRYPADIKYVGYFSIPEISNCYEIAIDSEAKTLYATGLAQNPETRTFFDPEGVPYDVTFLYATEAFDISDPYNPKSLGHRVNFDTWTYDVILDKGFAYTLGTTGHLRAHEVSNGGIDYRHYQVSLVNDDFDDFTIDRERNILFLLNYYKEHLIKTYSCDTPSLGYLSYLGGFSTSTTAYTPVNRRGRIQYHSGNQMLYMFTDYTLRSFDASDPANLVPGVSVGTPFDLDINDIVIDESRDLLILLHDGNGQKIQFYDISVSSSITNIGGWELPNESYDGVAYMAVKGEYLYVYTEYGGIYTMHLNNAFYLSDNYYSKEPTEVGHLNQSGVHLAQRKFAIYSPQVI